jgi:hypothetical protein
LLAVELKKAEDILSKYLVEYAKKNHRFDSKTGKLISAIKVKGTIQTGLNLYVDLNVADYAEHVVYGQRSWLPDNFIEETLTKNEAKINEIINKAVSDAVNKMNGI